MARNEQLIRQHKILQILERRRFGSSLEDIRDSVVEELGLTSLHVRSIRRDLEALQAAGMDIGTEETQTGKVWKLRRVDKGLHKIAVTASELISLSMGRDLMLPLVGTTFWQGIEAFWNKIREQLPSGVWEHYQRYRRTLRVMGLPHKSYEKQQGVLKTVNRAVQSIAFLSASTNRSVSHRRYVDLSRTESRSINRASTSLRSKSASTKIANRKNDYVIGSWIASRKPRPSTSGSRPTKKSTSNSTWVVASAFLVVRKPRSTV